MLKKIKKIISLSIQAIDMIIYYIISRFYKNNPKYKNMWLISERGTEAKDNGYVFFKYLRDNHPDINVYYLIDSSFKNDYHKVKHLKNIIEYNSFEHKIAFLLCDKAISSHIGFLEPWSYKLYKLILDRKSDKKYVILQHGIINHDLSNIYSKKATKADLFITSTNNEYLSIANNNSYGYFKNEVVNTGLARFDLLNDDTNTKNQLLLMPTWRKDIVNPSYIKKKTLNDSVFLNSNYFKKYNSLLNNKTLHKLLKEYNYNLVFYPHYEIQQYLKYFSSDNTNIIIASKEQYDVQTLLKESKLLITDYSSVFFDFAYMKKPIIYYQFDEGHYKKGYFDHKKDGFGDVINKEDEVIESIKTLFDSDFKMKQEYIDRVDNCFTFIDNNNCERIYKEIIKL